MSWSRNCPHCQRKPLAPVELGIESGWSTQAFEIARALGRWPPAARETPSS